MEQNSEGGPEREKGDHGTCAGPVYEYFLGGEGLAAWVMWKECPRGTTAFDPANRLTFAAGPMQGIKQTGAAKWAVGGISPSINMNAGSAITARLRHRNEAGGLRCGRGSRPRGQAGLRRDRRRQGQDQRRLATLGQGRLRGRGSDPGKGGRTVRGGHHRPGRGTVGALCQHPDRSQIVCRPLRIRRGHGLQAAQGSRRARKPETARSAIRGPTTNSTRRSTNAWRGGRGQARTAPDLAFGTARATATFRSAGKSAG